MNKGFVLFLLSAGLITIPNPAIAAALARQTERAPVLCIVSPCPGQTSRIPEIAIPNIMTPASTAFPAQTQSASRPSTGNQWIDIALSVIDGIFNSNGGSFQDNSAGSLSSLITSTIGSASMPDNKQVEQTVFEQGLQTEGGKLNEAVEIGTGTFSARRELSQRAIQEIGKNAAHQSALSKQAQDAIVQRLKLASQNSSATAQLGEEAKGKRVTQQIMQGQSQQLGLIAGLQELLVQDSAQARIDRGMSNVLLSQIAENQAAQRTASRREATGVGNSAYLQGGLMMMPGGVSLNLQHDATAHTTSASTSSDPFAPAF